MRLQCAKPLAEAKQSSGLGDTNLHQGMEILIHRIDAIWAAITALPPSHGLARASLQLSSAGYCTFDVLPGRNCGNKAQLVFDFDQLGRKKAVAPA
jgi:hypothetical protein